GAAGGSKGDAEGGGEEASRRRVIGLTQTTTPASATLLTTDDTDRTEDMARSLSVRSVSSVVLSICRPAGQDSPARMKSQCNCNGGSRHGSFSTAFASCFNRFRRDSYC